MKSIAINGQLTVKRLYKKNNQLFLIPQNKKFNPIKITQENKILIFSVMAYIIHAI